MNKVIYSGVGIASMSNLAYLFIFESSNTDFSGYSFFSVVVTLVVAGMMGMHAQFEEWEWRGLRSRIMSSKWKRIIRIFSRIFFGAIILGLLIVPEFLDQKKAVFEMNRLLYLFYLFINVFYCWFWIAGDEALIAPGKRVYSNALEQIKGIIKYFKKFF